MRLGGMAAVWALAAGLSRAAFAFDGGEILRIPATARGLSLGGPEVCTGTEALFYNPAGLAAAARPDAAMSHAELFGGTRLDALGASAPTRFGSLGVSGLLLTQGAIEGRDAAGNAAGAFQALDRVVGVSWAAGTRGWRVGATAKHLEERLADAKAAGWLADVGGQAQVGSRLSFGVSIMNLGRPLRFVDESFAPPTSVGLSAGLDIGGGFALLGRARHRPNAGLTEVAGGAELVLGGAAALRAAIERSIAEALPAGPSPIMTGFSGGLGLRASKAMLLDYAFTPGVDGLGQMHRVTLRFEFGGETESNGSTWGEARPRAATWDNYWRRDADGKVLGGD